MLVPKGSGQGLKPGMRATVGLYILLLQAAHGHTALPAFQGSSVVRVWSRGVSVMKSPLLSCPGSTTLPSASPTA